MPQPEIMELGESELNSAVRENQSIIKKGNTSNRELNKRNEEKAKSHYE